MRPATLSAAAMPMPLDAGDGKDLKRGATMTQREWDVGVRAAGKPWWVRTLQTCGALVVVVTILTTVLTTVLPKQREYAAARAESKKRADPPTASALATPTSPSLNDDDDGGAPSIPASHFDDNNLDDNDDDDSPVAEDPHDSEESTHDKDIDDDAEPSTTEAENPTSFTPPTQPPPPQLQQTEKHLRWWDRDPPGMDPSTKRRTSIWQYELSLALNASRTDWQRKHPQLVFIKGLKVGGTSIALALDNAARRYHIRLQDSVNAEEARRGALSLSTPCREDSALFFHHAPLMQWMSKCIPEARFVTLLRDPVSQSLSWEAMEINRQYYIDYPRKPCDKPGHVLPNVELEKQLRHIDSCVDTPLRHNLTLGLIAQRVRHHWPITDPGSSVSITTRWVSEFQDYGRVTGPKLIETLKKKYFLVGVSERINEFLMVLALHMGWDPAALVYRKCKATDADVTRAAFERRYPDLGAKLAKASAPVTEAYEWAKAEFDAHIKRMPPWFPGMVRDFEAKLKEYQKQWTVPGRPFKWRHAKYLDGVWEFC